MIKKLEIQKGVTIVELLVYMGLLSIFIVVILDVLLTVLDARLQAESTSSVDQDTNFILAKLSSDIYNADSVTYPVNAGDSGNSLTLIKNGIAYSYSEDASGNFIVTTGSSSANLNSTNTILTGLSFKRTQTADPDTKPVIKINYSLKSVIEVHGKVDSRDIETAVGLR